MRCAIVLAVVAACGHETPPAHVAPPEEPPPVRMEMTRDGVGPLTHNTSGTLTAVREELAPLGVFVKPAFEHALELQAFDGTTQLLYVVPDEDGSILFIHATSGQITIGPHPTWEINAPFHDSASLGHCDCWGDWPVCYRTGEHVAAGFVASCEGLDSARGRRRLDGAILTRVVWSPKVFEAHDVPSFVPRQD
jgi:hypothetical protein